MCVMCAARIFTIKNRPRLLESHLLECVLWPQNVRHRLYYNMQYASYFPIVLIHSIRFAHIVCVFCSMPAIVPGHIWPESSQYFCISILNVIGVA